jgi:hypothetical protein
VAVLVVVIVLGMLVRHAQRLHAASRAASLSATGPRFTSPQSSTTMTPTSRGPATAPPAAPASSTDAPAARTSDLSGATPAAAPAAAPAATAAPARPNLAGTWRGAYVDASGKQLLRVTSLSISSVHHDGGIEGTMQYESASGYGECKLRPHGSTYSAGAQRLQLSPEACSPHYPKELGVPLDFDGVTPQANALKNGHIEAPTGEIIRVNLSRTSGAQDLHPESTEPPARRSHSTDSPNFGRSYPATVNVRPSAIPLAPV